MKYGTFVTNGLNGYFVKNRNIAKIGLYYEYTTTVFYNNTSS